MILQQLYKDAERILGGTLIPEMYKMDSVRWLIPLTDDGKLNGTSWVKLGDAKRGGQFLIPYPGTRTSGAPKPALIVDYPAYVLGTGESKERPEAKHAAYRKLLKECLVATKNHQITAIDCWLDRWDDNQEEAPSELTSQDRIAFEVSGIWPTDSIDVQAFWAEATQTNDPGAPQGLCLVSGRRGPTLSSMPSLLKGIPEGQSSGVAIVSNNAKSFESYGRDGAYGSPILRDSAERFTKAINHLVASERSKIRVGKLIYIFWTYSGPDTSLYSFLSAEPDPAVVQNLISSAWNSKSQNVNAVHAENFYGLALSASGARAVVRDWLQSTVSDVQQRLSEWFDSQKIISVYGGPSRYYAVYSLAKAAYRDGKDIETKIVQSLIRFAIEGDPLPFSLLALAVARCRVERKVTNSRAALIKAVLVTNQPKQNRRSTSTAMEHLNTENQDPAYQCGRLLAQLDAVQYAALGKIGATITDRYYGTASSAPAVVFGALLSNANKAHLPKLRKTKPAVYYALQKSMEEILSHVSANSGFPRTLTLSGQALFSLGFYHQRAENRRRIEAAKLAKATNTATSADVEFADLAEESDTE